MNGLAASPNIALDRLAGVGPRTRELLQQLNIENIVDLLFHLPNRYEDRTRITPINDVRVGDRVLVEGHVTAVNIVGRRASLTVQLMDASGAIQLRFFHFNKSQLQQFKQEDLKLRCFGEIRQGFRQQLEIVHPEYRDLSHAQDLSLHDRLTAIYPITKGLSQRVMRKLVMQALDLITENQLPELLPQPILTKFKALSLAQALRIVHMPAADVSLSQLLAGKHIAQQRLAFEELLAHHVSFKKLRHSLRTQSAIALVAQSQWVEQLLRQLPFQLTRAQQRVCNEIQSDLAQPYPMLRLLQGDVGSGKTVIAALAILQAVAAGYQAVLMAPTEILAEQHLVNLQKWLSPLNITIGLLLGRHTGKERQQIIQAIKDNNTQVIVGTHAVFQEDVEFAKLALIIIDEQHRFGVHQRMALSAKGKLENQHPHQLIMTATPIPRTLAMTAYADLDVSVIDELPPGRQPITTLLFNQQRRDEIIQRVHQNCQQGKQAYWVCTLIDESEALQCVAAEKTFEYLRQALAPLRVGLVHGRMKADVKDQLMQAFKSAKLDLLVATTVVEVGVDVPNATLMIIENAERLGLAQLHQLRGRVGRGDQASYCVLLYQAPLSRTAQQRLQIMRKTQDGFKIANADLAMRGPGELLGTRQAGLLRLRIADIVRDQALLADVASVGATLEKQPGVADALINRWLKGKLEYKTV